MPLHALCSLINCLSVWVILVIIRGVYFAIEMTFCYATFYFGSYSVTHFVVLNAMRILPLGYNIN